MKTQIISLSLILSLTSSVYAAIPLTVRIGTDATYAPFSAKDSKGEVVGFDIDLGNELCKRMQTKCIWIASDFDSLIPSLKAKKIDAIISSLSITEKRQHEILFSNKLYAGDSRLIATKGSPLQPSVESLKGKHVGVLQGSTQEAFANAEWRPKGIEIVPYSNQDLIYSDLAAGRLDVALQDEITASEGFLKQPVGKDFAFAGPSMKSIKYFGDGTGIGLRKEDTELKAAFDKALAAMRADGTYNELAKKYFDFDVYGK